MNIIYRSVEKPMGTEDHHYYSYISGMKEVKYIVTGRIYDINYILEWKFDDED